MKYVLVAALNRLFNAFLPPQAINEMTDDDIIESNRRAVLNGQIPKEQAEKLVIYKVGTFDDSIGVIEPIEPQLLCNLASFLPRKVQVAEEVKKDVNAEIQ